MIRSEKGGRQAFVAGLGEGSNPFLSTSIPFLLAVETGTVPGYRLVELFGQTLFANTTMSDVWTVGGNYVFPSDTGVAMTIVSTDAGDSNVMVVEGLDENFDEKIESVALNGVTPVALSGLWARINKMFVDDSVETVGIVNVQNGGNIHAQVLPLNQTSLATIYTVPTGHSAFGHTFRASANRQNSQGSADVFVRGREFGKVFRSGCETGIQVSGSSFWQQSNTMIGFKEKTDVKASVIATANMDIASSISFVLIDNNFIV